MHDCVRGSQKTASTNIFPRVASTNIFSKIFSFIFQKYMKNIFQMMALTNIFPRTSSTNIFSKILSLDIFQKGMKIYILNDGMNKYLSKDCINNIFSKISTFDIFQKGMKNIFQMMTTKNNFPENTNKYKINTKYHITKVTHFNIPQICQNVSNQMFVNISQMSPN